MHIPKWYVMFQIIRYLIKMMITIYSFLLWGSASKIVKFITSRLPSQANNQNFSEPGLNQRRQWELPRSVSAHPWKKRIWELELLQQKTRWKFIKHHVEMGSLLSLWGPNSHWFIIVWFINLCHWKTCHSIYKLTNEPIVVIVI